jgi:hypothetical protein
MLFFIYDAEGGEIELVGNESNPSRYFERQGCRRMPDEYPGGYSDANSGQVSFSEEKRAR